MPEQGYTNSDAFGGGSISNFLSRLIRTPADNCGMGLFRIDQVKASNAQAS
jgi:hypothetical protein